MNPRVWIVSASAALIAGAALAHEAMALEGKVTNRTSNTFDVKTVKGETYTVFTSGVTKVLIGGQRLEFDSLKVGQAVVVDGFGDAPYSLTALQIRVTQSRKPAKQPLEPPFDPSKQQTRQAGR